MSVIDYVYLRDAENCDVDAFVKAATKLVKDLEILECERMRSKPNWRWLSFGTPQVEDYCFVFGVERNTRENIREVEGNYPNNASLAVIRAAKKYVWSSIRIREEARRRSFRRPLRELDQILEKAIAAHLQLLFALVNLSNGIIERPENEQLYTARSFATYIKNWLVQKESSRKV